MKIRYLAAGAAVAMAVATMSVAPGAAGASGATAPQPTASFGTVETGGGLPTIVRITYKCTSTVSPANHLYLAVKQGPDVNTTNHSSSQYAKTYYSTTWSPDSGPNQLNCNGVRHTQRIVLQPDPYFVQKEKNLHAGLAFVQICLYDNITGADENGEPIGGVVLNYSMQNVRVRGH